MASVSSSQYASSEASSSRRLDSSSVVMSSAQVGDDSFLASGRESSIGFLMLGGLDFERFGTGVGLYPLCLYCCLDIMIPGGLYRILFSDREAQQTSLSVGKNRKHYSWRTKRQRDAIVQGLNSFWAFFNGDWSDLSMHA